MTVDSILARGRSPFYLSALEATFIKTFNPTLCRQKEFVYSLKIVIMTLSCWSFFSQSRLDFFLKIAAPFPALSILTILIDYCHTKSCFEAMNILIKPFSSSVLGWSEKNFFLEIQKSVLWKSWQMV